MAMSGFQLVEATIASIHRAFRSGELSARHLTELYLARIDAYDRSGPMLNAVIAVNERALEDAGTLDERFHVTQKLMGPLHGIPVVLKDSIATVDVDTMYGSVAFRGFRPSEDATVTRLLRDAGAVILGKTALPDFACSWFGHSSASGETLNPYDPARDPGGSSSGTASAVAANLSALGVGGDTGGSIRVPSSFNSVVGLRPTTGLISRKGVAPLVSFEDTCGPVTRSVRDAACLLDVLAGYDPGDPYTAAATRGRPVAGYAAALHEDRLNGARIGVLRDFFGTDHDAQEVNTVIEQALCDMAAAGAEIVDPVAVPEAAELLNAATLYAQQCRHDLNEFLSSLPNSPVRSFDDLYSNKVYHPLLDFWDVIATGPDRPEEDPAYYRGFWARERLQRHVLNAMAASDVDVFAYPSVQVPPPLKSDVAACRWTTLNFPANTAMAPHATMPAISMPGGFTGGGLPVGIELLGRPYEEERLLGLAYAFEQSCSRRRPPAFAPALPGED